MNLPFGITLSLTDSLISFGLFLVVCIPTVMVHEGLHGLFFWIYTGKVEFGFKLWAGVGPVAYATSPGSIMSKWKMIVVLLIPQIFTTVLLVLSGLVLFSNLVRMELLSMAAFNLGGGSFDLYFVYLLLKEKSRVFVQDTMTGMKLYKG